MKKNRIFIVIIAALIIILGVFHLYPSDTRISGITHPSDNALEALLNRYGFYRPPFELPMEKVILFDLNQNPVRLSDYKGAIVFLNFWATWCPPCRDEMPAMQKLFDRYKNESFKMIAVSMKESPVQVMDFFKTKRLSFTALLDPRGEVGKIFGINAIPTTFLLDKDGRIIGRAIGPRDWDGKEARALIQHLIAMS